MATLLLVLIYVSFISLGLPDALLGAAWPVMQPEFGVPYGLAGLAQIIISGGTIVSSMVSGAVLKRFGIGKVTAVSVGMTALALLGFSIAPSFWWLLAAAVPLGLGAGSVDAGLNSFVASHYESRHMSWLHSFWGVGALGGPLVLSALLYQGFPWRTGYASVGVFQVVLVVVLIAAIPLWSRVRVRAGAEGGGHDHEHIPLFAALKIRGVGFAMLTFLVYCGIEASMGLWGGSYLFKSRGLDPAQAATWVSLFYASITAGRFLTGFLTYRLSNRAMIRGGAVLVLFGVILMLLPLSLPGALTGFLLIGLGCAPIFPCMLHETPVRFGAKHSQAIMGFQMALAYVGSTVLPPLFGLAAGESRFWLLPVFALGYILVLLASTVVLDRQTVPNPQVQDAVVTESP